MKNKTQKIVVFASGSGSNAECIIQHFASRPKVEVSRIYTNNPQAYVLERAQKHRIYARIFTRSFFESPDGLLKELLGESPDMIVLAGFLWKMPESIVVAFPNKIINLHPALLPRFGGKGMYGMHVHRAVIDSGASESGITIHYVNENYDEGATIFQAKVSVTPFETPDTLSDKIHNLEHTHFAKVIEKLLTTS